jgi:hypothetical protein
MTDLPTLPPRPDLTVRVGDQIIKMTYGLEMDLRRMLPDPNTAVSLLRDDQYTQDYVVRRVLTPTKRMITDKDDLIDMESVDISSDDVETILTWAAEHALYFFMSRTLEMAKLGVRYQLVQPTPSTDGSETSASTTPSAGPSELSKETSTTSSGDTLAAS